MPRVAPVDDGDPQAGQAGTGGSAGPAHAGVTAATVPRPVVEHGHRAAGAARAPGGGRRGGRPAGPVAQPDGRRRRAGPRPSAGTPRTSSPARPASPPGSRSALAPSRWHRAISSMSNAKPAVRSAAPRRRASGPEKNLNPHWVSVAPGTTWRARARNAAAPSPAGRAVPVLHHRGVQRRGTPTTNELPAVSRPIVTSRAARSVAMSASQKPDERGLGGQQPGPDRTAPCPGGHSRSSRTGTGPAGQLPHHVAGPRRCWRCPPRGSPLGSGRQAALRHRASSPPGSLRASLWAGTTISIGTGAALGAPSGGRVTTARPGQRFPY